MNHDAMVFGTCSNCVDSRDARSVFSGGVKGSEHTIEASARCREHQQVRRNSADIAIGAPSIARGKERLTGAETQRIGRALDFDHHFAA
jgi:hypothetical protein